MIIVYQITLFCQGLWQRTVWHEKGVCNAVWYEKWNIWSEFTHSTEWPSAEIALLYHRLMGLAEAITRGIKSGA